MVFTKPLTSSYTFPVQIQVQYKMKTPQQNIVQTQKENAVSSNFPRITSSPRITTVSPASLVFPPYHYCFPRITTVSPNHYCNQRQNCEERQPVYCSPSITKCLLADRGYLFLETSEHIWKKMKNIHNSFQVYRPQKYYEETD